MFSGPVSATRSFMYSTKNRTLQQMLVQQTIEFERKKLDALEAQVNNFGTEITTNKLIASHLEHTTDKFPVFKVNTLQSADSSVWIGEFQRIALVICLTSSLND